MTRPIDALDGAGAVHVDRIVRDCLARRLPADETRIRLLVAATAAEVLDA